MDRAFREVENTFQVLRQRFRDLEISRREFIDQLKKLRLRDDQGRFWMIGAQTGRWYYFDGKEWVQAEPPAESEIRRKRYLSGQDKAEGVETGAMSDESVESSPARCPTCGEKLESPFQKCPSCSRETEVSPFAEEALLKGREKRGDEYVLKYMSVLSAFYAGGGFGLILGVAVGAGTGASGGWAGLASRLPDFLATLHGTLMGGIVFGVIGGIAGFLIAGLLGCLLALIFNLTASVSGGIRIAARRPAAPPGDKKSDS